MNGLVVDANGAKFWYKNGLYHREDGPAIEWNNGDKVWFKNGLRHREDGPAVEWYGGMKFWYYEGILLNASSQKEFIKLVNLKLFW